MEAHMMSGKYAKKTQHKNYRNGVDSEKIRFITGHAGYLKKARAKHKRSQLADVVSLNRATIKEHSVRIKPRLPESINVVNYENEQVPYIEPLGWLLVYLFKRYPELKHTPGFDNGHIKGDKNVARTGFYEAHAYTRIDVGNDNTHQNYAIDIVHGQFDDDSARWSVEVFLNGGLVRKHICETQDQIVAKLDQQLNKYGLIQLAWQYANRTR